MYPIPMEVIFIVHSFSILNIVQDRKRLPWNGHDTVPQTLFDLRSVSSVCRFDERLYWLLLYSARERAPIFSKYANFQFGLKVQFPPDVPNAMHNSNIWLYIILNVSLALRAKALNRICWSFVNIDNKINILKTLLSPGQIFAVFAKCISNMLSRSGTNHNGWMPSPPHWARPIFLHPQSEASIWYFHQLDANGFTRQVHFFFFISTISDSYDDNP